LLPSNELAVVITCLCTTRTSYGQPITRPETKKQKLDKRISNTCKSRHQSIGSWAFWRM